jgi:hypothetical protein
MELYMDNLKRRNVFLCVCSLLQGSVNDICQALQKKSHHCNACNF